MALEETEYGIALTASNRTAKIKEMSENIDMDSNLLDAGSSLFAAALIGAGLTGKQAVAAELTPIISRFADDSMPLDAFTAAAYRRGDWSPAAAGQDNTEAAAPVAAAYLDKGGSAAKLAVFINDLQQETA